MKLHEYQRKGVTRKAFRNWLILKDTILGCFGLSKGRNGSLERKKREHAPALPDAYVYKTNCITEKERVKEKFQKKPLQK
jgi:hypothetical protein